VSGLLDLRTRVKAALVDSGLWTADEVIIRRRGNIWNDIAIAVESSKGGRCLVIGTAKGDPDPKRPPRSKIIATTVTVPVSIIELPEADPEVDDEPEDELWEKTVILLQGNNLGGPQSDDFIYDGFDEIEAPQYLIRQTLFKTRIVLRPTQP
jgi:hypothetical protein